MLTKSRYDCTGEYNLLLFAVLVGDGALDRARANAFRSMLPNSDDLMGFFKLLVVVHLILQSGN